MPSTDLLVFLSKKNRHRKVFLLYFPSRRQQQQLSYKQKFMAVCTLQPCASIYLSHYYAASSMWSGDVIADTKLVLPAPVLFT